MFLLGQVVVAPAVDLAAYVVSATTVLGLVVAAVILAYAGFKVIKLGLRWFGRMGG